ncbi:hypothetical protein F5X96DRAFT_688730 [Biscogniauxia mediterranea]|nr:hypothetical protein F5X96DRAFT_688730 [Biscogniauxia mediterranea]
MGSYNDNNKNNNHSLPYEPPRYPFVHDNNDDRINMNADQGSLDVSTSRASEHYMDHQPLEFPISLFKRPNPRNLLVSHPRRLSPDLLHQRPLHTYPFFPAAPDEEAEAEANEVNSFPPIAGSSHTTTGRSPWLGGGGGGSGSSPPQPPRRAHTTTTTTTTAAAAAALEQSLPRGVSPNYRGNPYLAANQSADIPDSENTALWLTNLPPDCDHRMLLSSVRGCGKVYATVINPPMSASAASSSPSNSINNNNLPNHLHPHPYHPHQYPYQQQQQQQPHITSACKLVFFDVCGARSLLRQAREGHFAVGGYVPRVRHNRIRSAARPPGPQSRVLHIEGPDRVVNEPFLSAFFAARFSYEIEDVIVVARSGGVGGIGGEGEGQGQGQGQGEREGQGEGRTRLEWRFGSYRCQAESARAWIAREKERACAAVSGAGAGSVQAAAAAPPGGGGSGSGSGGSAGFRTFGLSAPGSIYRNPGFVGCNDYMSPQELLLRHLQSQQQLLEQQRLYESQAELEERLAWQAVTVHFAVDPCSMP